MCAFWFFILLSLITLKNASLISEIVCCHVKVNRPEENGSETTDAQSAENGEVNGDKDSCKVPQDIFDFYEKMDRDEDDETELQTVSFEIQQDCLEKLQRRFVTRV